MTPNSLPHTTSDSDAAPENPFEAQLQENQSLAAQNPPVTPTEAGAPDLAPTSPPMSAPPLAAKPLAAKPRRRALWAWLLLLLPLGGAGAYFARQRREAEALYRRNRAPLTLPERMARVPAAWSAETLGARLKQNGKIRDLAAFREAATAVGLQNVTPGSYFLPAIASPLDLARAFKSGPTHRQITFPEGFTAQQFAARLRKNGVAGAQKMAEIAPAQLEGKLFPATYEVPFAAPTPALVALFEARWKSEMAKLPRPFPKIAGKEMTPMQIVTLASIIEREAASSAEMPQVAGALINRLRRPMRLQVDASVQYARLLANQAHKGRLLFEDLEINSPYNTYRNDGLPPTPICNPGATALRAAARPATTDALFYVYSPKLKRHLFAKNYAEHLHYVAQVRRERAELRDQNGASSSNEDGAGRIEAQ